MPRAGLPKREDGHEGRRGSEQEGPRQNRTLKLPKDYASVAREVIRSYGSAEEQQQVARVLGRENSVTMYQDMIKAGYSRAEAIDMLKSSVKDLARGEKVPSFKAYEEGRVAGDTRRAQYAQFLRYMREDGILSKEDEAKYLGKIKRIRAERHRGGESLLEGMAQREAAVWLFMAIGAILILISGFSMTGAAVGSMFEVTSLFVIGLALFVIGLLLKVKN